MKLVADENIEVWLVEALRSHGHEIHYIYETNRGAGDETVLEIANQKDSLLLTSDKDFGELVYRLGQASKGVILLRIFGMEKGEKTDLVIRALEKYGEEMPGTFTAITSKIVRIRKLK